MALAELQASLTVTLARTLGTVAWQVPSALTGGMAEQVMVGKVVSVTVNVVEHEAVLPDWSVAVTMMVYTPGPTSVPALGDWLRVILPGPAQPSPTLTSCRTSGTVAWQVPSLLTAGSAEQV